MLKLLRIQQVIGVTGCVSVCELVRNQRQLAHSFFFCPEVLILLKRYFESHGLKVSYLRWFLLTWEKLFECGTWIYVYICMFSMARFWLTKGQVTWHTIIKIYIAFLKKTSVFSLNDQMYIGENKVLPCLVFL